MSTTETQPEPGAVAPDVPLSPKHLRRLRVAIVLILVGLVTEVFALLAFTPATFLLFVMIGVPTLGLGMLIYLITVVADFRRRRIA